MMKPLSLVPLISTSLALCATSSYAGSPGTQPCPGKDPAPGNSQKCTRVDFDHDNNGWGNGDQDAPGNSGDHNNAENGPGSAPGNGNGNHSANTSNENLAPDATDDATQKELKRLEGEALERQAQMESAVQSQKNEASKNADTAANASVTNPANKVVARRAK